jgi:AbrB family looped-hinge helix DNA binding protein
MVDSTLTRIVRPIRRGQLTIPAEFRRRLGIDDDTLLQLTLHEDRIEVIPVVTTPAVGKGWAKELYEMFASVREKAQTMGEAEIDALIDEAIDEVRAQGDQSSL